MRHHWGDDAEAAEQWTNTVCLEANVAQRDLDDALRSRGARLAIEASDSAGRRSDRLIRRLRGLYEVFEQLQLRRLADPTPEEHHD